MASHASERRSHQRILAERYAQELEGPLLIELIAAAELYVAQLSDEKIAEIRQSSFQGVLNGRTFQDIAHELAAESGHYRSLLAVDERTDLPYLKLSDKDTKAYIGRLKDNARLIGGRLMVLFIDCDNLGLINKNEPGRHNTGDKYIIEAARILKEEQVAGMRIYRRGKRADEFLVLGLAPETEYATQLVKRIGNNAAENLARRSRLRTVKMGTITIGGVLAPPGYDIKDALREADRVMGDAKQEGKNRFIISDLETGDFPSGEFVSIRQNDKRLRN